MAIPSRFQLSAMRTVFALNFLLLALYAWPQIIRLSGAWDPLRGVAFSAWATLSLLCAVGVRYPLKMTPILFFQLIYKSIWLLAIYLPGTATPTSLLPVMLGGVVVDLR